MPEMNISKAQFGNTSWNPFSAASRGVEKLGAAATNAVTNSALGQQIQASQQAAHEASAANLEHDKWTTLATHVLGQEAATSEHNRRLEFFKTTTKHAEGGTPVGVTTGDYKASFTKKNKRARAPKATTSNAVPVHLMTKPLATTAAPVQEGPKPTVTRGAGGKMVSLKNTAASTPAPKKKAAKAAGAPVVGRDPKTGKAISLKKQ